jgi:SMC interacting uncharacterized protein involved in chromosome segregation
MKIAIENAAAVLADKDALKLKTASAYANLLYRRRVELQAVKDGIKHPNRENGTEDRWALTLATGTTADLEALEAEYDEVKRDLERVSAQYTAFRNMEAVCRKRESAAALPDRLVALQAKADAVTKARAALVRAVSDLESAYQTTATAYNAAGTDGDATRPNEKLVAQVIDAAKAAAFTPEGPLANLATKRPHRVAEQLRYSEPQGMTEFARPWREMARA